jgi:hypothetical protein
LPQDGCERPFEAAHGEVTGELNEHGWLNWRNPWLGR